MNYILKKKIMVSEFVHKLFAVCVFILLMVITMGLTADSFIFSLVMGFCCLCVSFVFFRSLLWDLFGKEIVKIEEQQLTIERLIIFSKKSIAIPIADILSTDRVEYGIEDNFIAFSSLKTFQYLFSIVSLNRGYIKIQTFFRSYCFCIDIHKRDAIIAAIMAAQKSAQIAIVNKNSLNS